LVEHVLALLTRPEVVSPANLFALAYEFTGDFVLLPALFGSLDRLELELHRELERTGLLPQCRLQLPGQAFGLAFWPVAALLFAISFSLSFLVFALSGGQQGVYYTYLPDFIYIKKVKRFCYL